MLTLLTFPGSFDQPSHSPFCVKAMCLLHMSGQSWQAKYLSDPGKMPLGRLPVLKTDERLIPDSHHIQAYLESLGADFNPGLSAGNKAHSHALIRMVELGLSPGLAHDRWLRDDCWAFTASAFFADVPALLRKPISGMVRKKVQRGLTLQGIAQFSEADRLDRLARDLDCLTTLLRDQPYLFGNIPTAADAATTPVLEMIRTLPVDTGLRRLMRENAALMSYSARARAALYPKL